MFRAIEKRTTERQGNKVIITRHLSCKHTQPEVQGGKAPKATKAWCKTCEKVSEMSPAPLVEVEVQVLQKLETKP